MRIAITRPREKSQDTLSLVEARGWEALIVPTVEIKPRENALEGIDLGDFDWLVLTSSFGAELVLQRCKDGVKKVKIACIGPRTAKELEKHGVKAAFIPGKFEAAALAEELLKKGAEGKKILVARASSGRELLVETLRKKARVTEVPLYDTVMVRDTKGIQDFIRSLDSDKLDAVIFTSSQAAKNLLSAIGEERIPRLNSLVVCAIGPITAETLRRRGIEVDIMPPEYTVEACLRELEKGLKCPGS